MAYTSFVLNFTFTFMPGKFTDSDTCWTAPQLIAKYFSKQPEISNARMVLEKHPERPNRHHMHGQLTVMFREPLNRFKFYQRISGYIRRQFGICCLKWDDPTEREGDYTTYWNYCLKDSEYWYSFEKQNARWTPVLI